MSRIDLPPRILAELPSKISQKIVNSEPLDESDQRVVCSYLDNTIIHPENTAETPQQLASILRFYMDVGAWLNSHTVRYAKNTLNSESLHNALNSYEKVSDEIKVVLKKSPIPTNVSNSTFLSFCSMNADKGFKTYNFYAENFGKLLKTLERWVKLGAPHLLDNCNYSIYVERQLVAKVVENRDLEPHFDQTVLDFISENFGQPYELDIVFDIERVKNTRFHFENIEMNCRVKNFDVSKRINCAVPESDELKLELVETKLLELTQELIKEIRFRESISADIGASIFVNERQVGVVNYDKDVPTLASEFTDTISEILEVQIEEKVHKCDEVIKPSWFKRIFGF